MKAKFLFYIIALSLALVFCKPKNDTPVTILIPETYHGPFYVVSGEPCGIKIPYEGERMLFQIPENGVLILRDSLPGERMIVHDYYLVKKDGKREKLDDLISADAVLENKKGICILNTGSIGMVQPDDPKQKAGKTIYYECYFVVNKGSSKSDWPAYDELLYKQDSIAERIVLDCRKGVH